MQRIISLLLLLPSLAFAQTQIPDGVISESSVTQHEAALTITESQISDLTHVTDTNTQLSDAQVATAAANEGFVTGAHTTNTNLDQSGVEALGFVTGSHTVDTDTNLDLAGVQALGFVAGAHTTDTNTSVLTECAGSQVLEADGDCIATSGLGGGGGSEGTTVSDTAEIDLTLTTVDITANIVAGSIDETKLDASVNASLDLADSAIQTEAQTLTSGTGFLSISGGNTVFLSSSDSYVNSVSVLRSTSELDFALSNSGVAADVALEIPLSSASQAGIITGTQHTKLDDLKDFEVASQGTIDPTNYVDNNTQLSDAEVTLAYFTSVDQVTPTEITVASSSFTHRWSPADVKSAVDQHSPDEVAISSNHLGITVGDIGSGVWKLNLSPSNIPHDDLAGFVANEHLDWTTDQGATNIHSGNYTDSDTTYAVGDGGLTTNDFTAADHTKLNGIEALAEANEAQVSAGEITAGTETALRSFSPADVKSVVDTHASSGGSSTEWRLLQNFRTAPTNTTSLRWWGQSGDMRAPRGDFDQHFWDSAQPDFLGAYVSSYASMVVGSGTILSEATLVLGGVDNYSEMSDFEVRILSHPIDVVFSSTILDYTAMELDETILMTDTPTHAQTDPKRKSVVFSSPTTVTSDSYIIVAVRQRKAADATFTSVPISYGSVSIKADFK